MGLEGVALLRAEVEDAPPGFAEARLAEVANILANLDQIEAGYEAPVVVEVDTTTGYALWAPYYDHEDNPLLVVEQPAVRRILDSLPPGDALDAACGSGRHTRYLVDRGHRVIGVDGCEAMLEIAGPRCPRPTSGSAT